MVPGDADGAFVTGAGGDGPAGSDCACVGCDGGSLDSGEVGDGSAGRLGGFDGIWACDG